ncbi:phage tail protein [Edwardsiella tarda]|uniref:phage tail-collar fiber domain-containing protein n=1 Tax=Edwardsiella tarda TaxID=636 RepID=UPI003A84EDB1
MSAKYFAILTNLGAAKMANATALGTKLNVTHMAVGDGGGSLQTPDPGQTSLRGERRRAALNMLSVDPNNTSQIIAEQVIPETEGGWWIREIGLYDSDGVLIAVANCPETYKPLLQEGSGRTQTIRMVLTVSSTEAVTLKIDPAVVLATRQYVDDKVIEVRSYIDNQLDAHAQSRNHPDATTGAKGFVQLSSETNNDREDRAATPKAVKIAMDNAGARLAKERNLADLTNAQLARQNLGLESTVALAAGALQKGKNGDDIPDKQSFIKNIGLQETVNKANNAVPRGLSGAVSGADNVPWNSPTGIYGAARDDIGDSVLISHMCGDNGSTRALQLMTMYANGGLWYRSSRDDKGFENQWTLLDSHPVGAAIPWPSDIIPKGYMKMNGSRFDPMRNPLLAIAYPSGVLPDMRGETIRGVDDGRGVDPGRQVLSWQDGSYMVREASPQNNIVSFPNANLSDLHWDRPTVGSIRMDLPYSGRSNYVLGDEKISYFGVMRMRSVAFHFIVRAA